MNYTVVISENAFADLRAIYEYIAFELASSQSASKQLLRIEKSIYALVEMPERYRLYDKEPWHSIGMRIMMVDNYCVFYIPNKETSIVSIFRIMYGGRNFDPELAKK